MAGRKPKLLDTPLHLSRSSLSKFTLILIKLLIIVTFIGFLLGIIKTFLDLELIFHESVEETLRQLLLNVITLLAVVEVMRTALSYINDGRVRVTFVVDTVLIVMLNEVLSTWFKGPSIESVLMLSIMIVTLIVVRILAIKFSPDND